MIRKLPIVALLIGAFAVTGQAEAHGGGWQGPAVFGAIVGSAIIGSALINQDRPVYVQQAPVYAPPPVYVQQPPPPVYYQPAPVYVQQPVYIQHGNSPSVFLCSRIVMAAVYGRPSGLPGYSTGLAHLCTAATTFEVRAKRCRLLKLE